MRTTFLFAALASLTLACGPFDVFDPGPPWAHPTVAQLSGVWQNKSGSMIVAFRADGAFRINDGRLLSASLPSGRPVAGDWAFDQYYVNVSKSSDIALTVGDVTRLLFPIKPGGSVELDWFTDDSPGDTSDEWRPQYRLHKCTKRCPSIIVPANR